jgi:phage FluMu gp28-like protein
MKSPLDLLLPYQRAWVTDPARFKIGLWARQAGKSFACAAEAVLDCLTRPGELWVILSAGERQAVEFVEKAKQWAAAFEFAIAAEEIEQTPAAVKRAEIRFGNGSRIVALPANAATARGYSGNVILDEFAFHEDADGIWRAIYPTITNPLRGEKRLRVVSTANGRGNKFAKLWEDSPYSRHKVTIEDARAAGLAVDLEALRQAIDDPDGWAQEYMCEFLDGSNVLLPYELIALAESAEATEADPGEAAPGGQRFAGIDFGRQNDPTVCWTLEAAGGLLWTREVLVLDGVDTPGQQAILRARIQAASRVCFDYTGPGVGLGDLLAQEFKRWDPEHHQFGKVELVTFTAGLKREMFPKLRRAFEAPTRVRVPISQRIREDLHAMQQVVNAGQYNYWAPRTREGHSDRCTALALAVRAAGDGARSCGVGGRRRIDADRLIAVPQAARDARGVVPVRARRVLA